jgi:hypothetical protein
MEQLPIAGEGYLGDVVEHDVDAPTRRLDGAEIAHVTHHDVDVATSALREIAIEDAYVVAAGEGTVDQDATEVPAAPGHEDTPPHQIG